MTAIAGMSENYELVNQDPSPEMRSAVVLCIYVVLMGDYRA